MEDLPKKDQIVEYKENDSEIWKKCIITGRGGRATGQYKYWLNIKHIGDETEMSIDWKNKVQEWRNARDVVLLTSAVDPGYEEAMQKELQTWKSLNVYEEVKDEGD